MRKLVRGVGFNDSETPVYIYENNAGKRRIIWKCPFYTSWSSMLRRCYDPECHIKYPTYAGCSVCEDWLIFSKFRSWMRSQDWHGKQLDKDFLVPGNKVYSPDTCVFISKSLNCFAAESKSRRGDCPLGVSRKGANKFQSSCRNPFTGKAEHLGYFESAVDAHAAWKRRKHEHAIAYSRSQDDERVASALIEIYAD